ncbi:putative tetratricopeptide-like helical domain superfamily [Helianthus annuus]|nr:putative tetratricopeptide-like helical domain superfamily [Helianthus annuus]
MESTLSLTLKPSFHQKPTIFNPPTSTFTKSTHPYPLSKPSKLPTLKITATKTTTTTTPTNPIIQTLKLTARTIIFSATTAAVISNFQKYPAIAEPITQSTTTTETEPETEPETVTETKPETVLPEFLESNSEAVDAMKTLLEKKLEAGEDEESLKILKKLVSAQPENLDWKFLMARLLNEMGEIEPAREALEQILTQNPLSFEALFENALIMDSVGEGEGVIRRLEKALAIAEEEKKEKEARDVRLIIAQFQFLQKNVDEALRSYDELLNEDPDDFRPYFAKGMIYSLIDKDDEAKVWFAKYRELSPKKYDVEGYIRTPLSRMKLFGTDEQN